MVHRAAATGTAGVAIVVMARAAITCPTAAALWTATATTTSDWTYIDMFTESIHKNSHRTCTFLHIHFICTHRYKQNMKVRVCIYIYICLYTCKLTYVQVS